MPFANYKNWEDCTSQNKNKKSPEAYCGAIKAKVEKAEMPLYDEFMKQYGDQIEKKVMSTGGFKMPPRPGLEWDPVTHRWKRKFKK
jgi:hypothetical protein